jgi:hypothetical protein
VEARFAAVDLLRSSMADPRVSGYFAEEKDSRTLQSVIKHIIELGDACPHNLRLVMIHLACNSFSSPLFAKEMFGANVSTVPALLVQLISSSLLDNDHTTTRVAAASLAFNLAVSNYQVRKQEHREGMAESEQVELAASILEALQGDIGTEEAVKALLLSFGYLVLDANGYGEVADLALALDAKKIIKSLKGHEKQAAEVVRLL